ncbi:phage portal protein [Cytobacillus spongiae]|uniref:phage portal protein n=1 Tax=Cytobacillus spongiae TaxID=2901381 RepID=UPI001F187C59|nr:phage portal protein [Cytobacillus spongiae]UII56705.1 phage portal protein [Cytobacillus spongiae]
MGFTDWFRNIIGSNKVVSLDSYFELSVKTYYKRLAIESCIDLIANTITRCNFQTFEQGVEKRAENYYLLNVEPNQNQNASEFWHSVINHLMNNNECLVIMQNDQLYIADEFTKKEFAFKENVYTDIVVKDFKLNKSYIESDVLYFKLNDRNIMEVINSLYNDYGKLISSGMNYYKRKNNKRYKLKGEFLRGQDDETQKEIDELFENQMKNWFDPDKEGSVFQIQDGIEMEDMSDGQKGNAGNNGTSRDIRELVNDIIDFVSMSFHVPKGLLRGDIADIEKLIDGFLMFCIKPIAKLLEDEINRKMYEKSDYLKRTYMKVDTSQLKIVDITQLATAVDKLFAVGGLCIDDILIMLGKEPQNTEWSQKRFVTKNYQDVSTLEGGETR